MIHIFTKTFKIDFQNRKWNYISYFKASNQKTSFTSCFLFLPRNPKFIFKTENRIIRIGNENIFPLSGPWSKNFFSRCFSFLPRSSKIDGNRIIQTRIGIFFPTSRYLIKEINQPHFQAYGKKNFSYKIFPIFTREFKIEL